MYYICNSINVVAYTDLIGKFPYCSTRGNNYIMVVYNYDGNAILAEPVKNKQAATLLESWKIIHEKIIKAGV